MLSITKLSLLFGYFMSATAYHLGQYKPSSPCSYYHTVTPLSHTQIGTHSLSLSFVIFEEETLCPVKYHQRLTYSASGRTQCDLSLPTIISDWKWTDARQIFDVFNRFQGCPTRPVKQIKGFLTQQSLEFFSKQIEN